MTHKQFILILQVLLKPIVGTTVQIDGSNYVDYVHNLITSLEYPYSMNKSSLKTPSAPHCQNSIIILLAWLTEFICATDDDQSMVEYCATEEFNSPDFTKQFMSKMGDAFVCWNNQDELEGSKIQEMCRMYLDIKVGPGENIETDVERLKKSIDQLQRESKPVSLMKELEDKNVECKQLKNISELGRISEDLSGKFLNLRTDLDSKVAVKENLNEKLKTLRDKVSKQKMTQEQRNELLIEITEMKSLLESRRVDVMDLTEGSSEREIQLSNLIQKKFSLIDRLNNSIYTLASECQVAGMHEKFDPSSFEIKTTNIGDTAALNKEIERLKRGLAELKEKYQHAIGVMMKSLTDYEVEEYQLIAELNVLAEETQKLKTSVANEFTEKIQIETEFSDFITTANQKHQQNSSKLEEMEVMIGKLNKRIETYRKYNAQIIADKEAFKTKSVAECKELYENRKKEVDEKRQKLNEMKTFLTEFAKAQKPLPENVQSIVNDVMKKRDLNNNSSSG